MAIRTIRRSGCFTSVLELRPAACFHESSWCSWSSSLIRSTRSRGLLRVPSIDLCPELSCRGALVCAVGIRRPPLPAGGSKYLSRARKNFHSKAGVLNWCSARTSGLQNQATMDVLKYRIDLRPGLYRNTIGSSNANSASKTTLYRPAKKDHKRRCIFVNSAITSTLCPTILM